MPLNGDPPGRPGVKLNGHGGSSSSRRTAKRLVGGERKWAWLRGKFPTVRPFIHSFIRSFIHSFVRSFIHSLTVAVGGGVRFDFLFRASLGGAAVGGR